MLLIGVSRANCPQPEAYAIAEAPPSRSSKIRLSADPLLQVRAFRDIGGAGARADACAIWICQWGPGEHINLDYIEGQGQVLGYYTNELRIRVNPIVRQISPKR